MRIHILSDLHLETGPKPLQAPEEAEVVVLAGDIQVGTAGLQWAQAQFPGQPVVYVLGNHEFYHQSIPELTEELKRQSQGGNVHVLENEAFECGGFTFLGCTLWTDFRVWPDEEAAMFLAGERIADYYYIQMRRLKRLFRPWDGVKLFERSVAWLHEELGRHDPARTIVVTHHAPSRLSIPPQHAGSPLNAAFVSDLDELVAESRIPLWIHGHTHENVDYRLARTRILSNQCGYAATKYLPGFNAGLVVKV
jgi:predicted phosphodiesterase